MPSLAVSATSESCAAGRFDLDRVAVLERRAGRGRRHVDQRLAEQAHRPDRRERFGRHARLVLLLDRQVDVDAGRGELHLGDLADLDAGDADDRAALQALHVGEVGLEVVALPGEAAGAADGNDEHRGERQGGDRHDADFQFRPGERSCAWHYCDPCQLQFVVCSSQFGVADPPDPDPDLREKRLDVLVVPGHRPELRRRCLRSGCGRP